MTRRGQGQDTETTITIHRSNRTNSALINLSIALMFNLTTNLLCHKYFYKLLLFNNFPRQNSAYVLSG